MNLKFKVVPEVTILNEGGLSRIWQYTHDDKYTFAIIGTQDKDTKEDREEELKALVEAYRSKFGYVKHKIRKLEGKYTYENKQLGTEISYVITNISLDDALDMANTINQETIIYKNSEMFAMVDCETKNIVINFSTDDKNMVFNDDSIKEFSSRLIKKNNADKEFVFTVESLREFSNWEKTFVGNVDLIREELLSVHIKG